MSASARKKSVEELKELAATVFKSVERLIYVNNPNFRELKTEANALYKSIIDKAVAEQM